MLVNYLETIKKTQEMVEAFKEEDKKEEMVVLQEKGISTNNDFIEKDKESIDLGISR